MLFLLPSDSGLDQSRSPEEMQREYRRLEDRLQRRSRGSGQRRGGRCVLTLLKEARLAQLRKHPVQAFSNYHRLRAEVEADLNQTPNARPLPKEAAKTLHDVQDYVNEQLINLGPQAQKKKD